MLEHVRGHFPDEFSSLGENGVRDLVRKGISAAAGYGFESQRDVCKYVDLMVCFGPDFDTSGACPWATRILGDETLPSPGTKMDALFAAAAEQAGVSFPGQSEAGRG